MYLPDATPVKHKCREPGYWQHEIQNTWLKCSTGSVPRAINNARTNHFKSALGGATYVYASWDSFPLVLAVPNQNHRSTDAQNQLIHCSLVGSHKFKPKSQYKGCSDAIFILKTTTREAHWVEQTTLYGFHRSRESIRSSSKSRTLEMPSRTGYFRRAFEGHTPYSLSTYVAKQQ